MADENRAKLKLSRLGRIVLLPKVWIPLVILGLIGLAGLIYFFAFYQPTSTKPTYKEYPSVAEIYRTAKVGDYVKVTLTVPADTVLFGDGGIKLVESDRSGVYFIIPPARQSTLKVAQGKNTVFGKITENSKFGLVCEVEDIQR